MRKIYGIIIAIALIFGAFTPVKVLAKTSDISVNAEYLIRDQDGIHSRYVVLATNASGMDISVKADFFALDASGNPIKVVHDCAEAVRNGQTFILYGQFKTESIADVASFDYSLNVTKASNCRYDAIGIDVQKDEANTLNIVGTNFSTSDVNLVNVRGIFFKEGMPVAFEAVCVGDSGYALHSGSVGNQQLAMVPVDYDDYIITYTVSSDSPLIDL